MLYDIEKSLCATGKFPFKALNNTKLLDMIKNKHFTPIHAIIIPTNRCNTHCSFCCCDDRNQAEELPLASIIKILDDLESHEVLSVTISGGGEPTIHPDFLSIISEIKLHGMKCGLVTNGKNIDVLNSLPQNSIEWCRISFGDGRDIQEAHSIMRSANQLLDKGIINYIGISYIITAQYDKELITSLEQIVENSQISYIKFTLDSANCEKLDYPQFIRNLPSTKRILSPLYFEEIKHTECLMNLIKPIFAADGFVYPCCEIQYNNENGDLCYSKNKKVCSHEEYFQNIILQKGYNSSFCKKCFHSTLVKYLESTKVQYLHNDWI